MTDDHFSLWLDQVCRNAAEKLEEAKRTSDTVYWVGQLEMALEVQDAYSKYLHSSKEDLQTKLDLAELDGPL